MQLSKTYDAASYEARIYEFWKQSGSFEPSGAGDPFCIIMPPPNANAKLHLGTATYVKQDVMARFQRMQGKKVLYSPGADHAGFETWYVYEKELAKSGKSRFDYSDTELYAQTWDFVQKNMHMAKESFAALGLSCAWSNFTYTLDDKIVKNVKAVFKKMWGDGLIYRGERLVNYCTKHRTSFSDIEIEHQERQDQLYQIAYKLVDGSEIIISTVRPETLFGDVAIAVHPQDPRYLSLIGQEAELPLTGRKIPIIADEEVEIDFGTGALKITPAHSMVDWDIAQRHELPVLPVIGLDGAMLDVPEVPADLRGLSLSEAREKTIDLLNGAELLRDQQPYLHSVGVCYKCHTVIEPMLMEQWFVKMQPLAEKAIAAIEADEVKFIPAKRKEFGLDYLRNIKDWNISRQCPWGISIPAFLNPETGEWIYDESDADEIEVDGKTYFRDRDTFDTWMSSSQFPYLSLGWPDGELYKEFYPTSWLHLGRDIFPQWGLRMIIMGLLNTGKVPFKELYSNGMIRGADGKKMSKSLDNNVPAEVMLDKYGSDGMRIGLLSIDTIAGSDKAFDESKLLAGRNFVNKLWNMARFIEGMRDGASSTDSKVDNYALNSSADHWIAAKFNHTLHRATAKLKKSDFGAALECIYGFVWNDFADWYLEASKSNLNLSFLIELFSRTLKLVHPFAPFVTEAIWQALDPDDPDILMIQHWPSAFSQAQKERALKFSEVCEIVAFARQVKALVGANIEISAPEDETADFVKELTPLKPDPSSILGSALPVAATQDVNLLLSQTDLDKFRSKIGEQIGELQAGIQNLENRLQNEAYLQKAPATLVEESKATLQNLQEQLHQLKQI